MHDRHPRAPLPRPSAAQRRPRRDSALCRNGISSDLYPGDRFAAVRRRSRPGADRVRRRFAERYRGKLAELAERPTTPATAGRGGQRATRRSSDLLGRIASYAGLVYSGDTTDPQRAKFYGDTQEQLTDGVDRSAVLRAGAEPDRRRACWPRSLAQAPLVALEALARGSRQGQAAPARRPDRAAVPREVGDRRRPPGTGCSTRRSPSLRFKVDGEELTLEPTLNKLQDPRRRGAQGGGRGAGRGVPQGNLRIFTLITNTLAKDKEISDRWRGFEDVADSRHLANRVEREVVDALVAAVREAYPRLSHRYYRLKAKWFGREQLDYWDRNAPLPQVEQRTIPWTEARDTVLDAYGAFSPEMADIARRFFDERWIDAPVRPGKAPGAFAHPTVPSAHPYVLLNYQGKPRDVMTLAHELGHGVHQVLAGAATAR